MHSVKYKNWRVSNWGGVHAAFPLIQSAVICVIQMSSTIASNYRSDKIGRRYVHSESDTLMTLYNYLRIIKYYDQYLY